MLNSAHIMVVHPDSEGRGRLREALRSVVLKGTYANARALKPAIDGLLSGQKFDFAFLSTQFPEDQLVEFLGSIKAMSEKQRPIVMLCLKPQDQHSSMVANLYAHGARGFVFEPYSPDELLSAMQIAQEKVSGQAESKDMRIAEFLLGDAMRLLDQVADWRSEGHKGGGAAGKELRRVASALKEAASKVDAAQFQGMMIERFGKATTKKKGLEPIKAPKKIREAPHPGVELRKIMTQRSLSKEKLLSIVKIEAAELEALLAEQVSITEQSARELSRAMGKTAKHWIQLQTAYDRYMKEKEEAAKKATF